MRFFLLLPFIPFESRYPSSGWRWFCYLVSIVALALVFLRGKIGYVQYMLSRYSTWVLDKPPKSIIFHALLLSRWMPKDEDLMLPHSVLCYSVTHLPNVWLWIGLVGLSQRPLFRYPLVPWSMIYTSGHYKSVATRQVRLWSLKKNRGIHFIQFKEKIMIYTGPAKQ